MYNFLKMDLFKMFKSKSFYITNLVLILLILSLASFFRLSLNTPYNKLNQNKNVSIYLTDENGAPINGPEDEASFNAMQDQLKREFHIGSLVQGTENNVSLFLVIFLSLFVASELETGFVKNLVNSKSSRQNLLLVKLPISFLYILIQQILYLTTLCLGCYIAVGQVRFPQTANFYSNIAIKALLGFAFSALIIGIVYWTKNKTVSIAAGIVISTGLPTLALNGLESLMGLTKESLTRWTIYGNYCRDIIPRDDLLRVFGLSLFFLFLYHGLSILRLRTMELR